MRHYYADRLPESKEFVSTDLSFQIFSNMDLRDYVFDRCIMIRVIFYKCDLRGALFQRCQYDCVDYDRCTIDAMKIIEPIARTNEGYTTEIRECDFNGSVKDVESLNLDNIIFKPECCKIWGNILETKQTKKYSKI